MNKIKTFHGGILSLVQSEVNNFAEKHKIINANVCSEQLEYDVYYTILVLYEED